ncbi:MAG TPA: GTPase ObgE [Nannocystis sp.]
MRFIDQVRIVVRAGRGGDGLVGWRREKFVPDGGPAGGDGGKGGDVIFVADDHLTTLLDLKFRQHFAAESGRPGGPNRMTGRSGNDLRIRVPVGTAVFFEGVAGEPGERPPWLSDQIDEDELEPSAIAWTDDSSDDIPVPVRAQKSGPLRRARVEGAAYQPGDQIGDLTVHGQELVVARGGQGGRGNVHFKSSTNRAPDYAEPGQPGEAFWLRLELKLLADVGIVGFPNVGKSTFIRAISRARPKVADYPFTTLVPQLGVVSLPGERSLVVADVPGLIPGASEGRGLGLEFLRHLERTRVLLHLLAPDPTPGRDPLADLKVLEKELARYGPMFAGRPRVVALNKVDTSEGQEAQGPLRKALREQGIPLFSISARTGEGVPELLEALWRRVDMVRRGIASLPHPTAGS